MSGFYVSVHAYVTVGFVHVTVFGVCSHHAALIKNKTDSVTHAPPTYVATALLSVCGASPVAHDTSVFCRGAALCVICQYGGGFLSMLTSLRNKNRSRLEHYSRFHCIIIIGYDWICGSDTQEELWAVPAWLRVTLCSVRFSE